MRAVVQRATGASVDVRGADGKFFQSGAISRGLAVLLGVENGDTEADALWLAAKAASLRVFEDADGKMNLSLKDTGGEALVVSQFTLLGNLRKGTRPSFNRAAPPEISIPLYEKFCAALETELGKKIPRGVFGAEMRVSLVNDGPVTIILDSRNKDI